MPSDSIPSLPKTTPMRTVPIESFLVTLKDGRKIQILVGEGDGFFREEMFEHGTRKLTTFQAFIAGGKLREVPTFKKVS